MVSSSPKRVPFPGCKCPFRKLDAYTLATIFPLLSFVLSVCTILDPSIRFPKFAHVVVDVVFLSFPSAPFRVPGNYEIPNPPVSQAIMCSNDHGMGLTCMTVYALELANRLLLGMTRRVADQSIAPTVDGLFLIQSCVNQVLPPGSSTATIECMCLSSVHLSVLPADAYLIIYHH